MRRYINWAILHTPCAPFITMFSYAVKHADMTELASLERFTASLEPRFPSSGPLLNPHRLYKLLCQAARLYIQSDSSLAPDISAAAFQFSPYAEMITSAHSSAGMRGKIDIGTDVRPFDNLSDWYCDEQQALDWLNQDMLS
ncbi:hypothetical protein BX600DRAFT_531068 [Xylariales sp. PMI_506]|nr:hypothetical protein BX600DRAFT_531068 [Xylariales sp. PMI_506]